MDLSFLRCFHRIRLDVRLNVIVPLLNRFTFPRELLIWLVSTRRVLMGYGTSNYITITPSGNFPSTYFNDYNLVATRYSFLVPENGLITSLMMSLDVGAGAFGITTGLAYTFQLFASISWTMDGRDYNAFPYVAIGSSITKSFGPIITNDYRTFTYSTTFSPPTSVLKGTRIVPTFTTQRSVTDQPGFIGVTGIVRYSQT